MELQQRWLPGGTKGEKQQAVSDVAKIIFNDKFNMSQTIDKYLVTSRNPDKDSPDEWELQEAINKGITLENSEPFIVTLNLFTTFNLNQNTPFIFTDLMDSY